MGRDDVRRLYEQRANLLLERRSMVDKAERERRNLTSVEAGRFDEIEVQCREVDERIERAKADIDIERILKIPVERRRAADIHRLNERRAVLHAEMRSLVDVAESEDRALTVEETAEFDRLQEDFEGLSRAVASVA